ncbi:TPA: hypothetical protein DD449_05375 [Candidatus Berkelbacteria bacterium]|nr:hypothetical protein [Candidatus Berkelbacteria bacterium]
MVAKNLKNPWAIFFIGVASHFLLDAIPHLDVGTFTRPLNYQPIWVYPIVLGEAIILALVYYKVFHKEPKFKLMMFGGFSAILVDVLDNLNFWKKGVPFFTQLHSTHEWFHYNISPDHWYLGLLTTLILTGGLVWYLSKS